MKPENSAFLFEVSWEVCNKVGGIHEVVASKALQAVEDYGDNYYLLGPDTRNNAGFVETDEPCWDSLRHAMLAKDLRCRFGRWDIPANPKVILVDFSKRYNSNQLLHELWERFGVDSLSGGFDYIEPVTFSYACGEAIVAAYNAICAPLQGNAISQFHEWMCGAGLLAVKKLAPEIGTVFTTHATMLGRAMAGAGVDIYKQMRNISPAQEASAYNITAKYSMESVSAREADIFTTVSHITADEATLFLGRMPDVITTNGLDMRLIPDFSTDREIAATNRAKLLEPVKRLLRHDLPENTRIMAISGRYEFHNKGVDIFLDALAAARQAMQESNTHILALLLVMGGHTGINVGAVSGDPSIVADQNDPTAGFLTSHHVYDAPHDPILNACKRLGLTNRPDCNVQIVFVPCALEGNDGFFNMPYFDILSGCDLGVFPSWYEPWGYTPHESAAYGVPTVTTDLSGFGIWAREMEPAGSRGVTILPRRMTNYAETVTALRDVLLDFATLKTTDLNGVRRDARELAEKAAWPDFFENYRNAYKLALEKSTQRGAMLTGARKRESLSRVLAAKSSTTPYLRTLTAVAELPPSLSRLRELAYNMWWCWHPDAMALFEDLNPLAWHEQDSNPVLMVEEADPAVLEELSRNTPFLTRYHKVMEQFDAYMQEPWHPIPNSPINSNSPVAYFSTEFGLHESLPLYSGGLGVLSGDHLKSASDLNIPLIGVGLLYKNGYFRQRLDKNNRQVAVFPENNFDTLPLTRVLDDQKKPLEISLELPSRTLYAQIWLCQVGRTPLYLMDTDISKNTDDDRRITARLYESDRDLRLRQEILLGMGGVRMVRKLGYLPAVFHMNEGHSAFLALERIRLAMVEDDLSFVEAAELIRGSTVFTTHTPVDAGNERFSVELIERYFPSYAQSIGMEMQAFLRFGRIDEADSRNFDMTTLALRLATRANAVSWLHGYVARRMWRNIWKGIAVSEVPIGYVTNGIHTASYVGPLFRPMLERYVAPNWLDLPANAAEWKNVDAIPAGEYWQARLAQKTTLLSYIREHYEDSSHHISIERSAKRQALLNLSPNALLIGFARRFAPYKRATMLFADPDRLARILNTPGRPVILVFSGKSHPADEKGIDLIQEVVNYSHDPRFAGKIFFIEDYSLAVSRVLVQGADVWLNTPRRPYEASGTSGEKVPVNGGINLSISDGWWVEGYSQDANKPNGWTIGPVITNGNLVSDQNDYADAESLYALLEEQVIPLYYERGADALPHRWIQMSKNSLKSLTAEYSTGRMVNDYCQEVYAPAARRGLELKKDRQALTRRLSAWRKNVASRFTAVHLEEIRIQGVDGSTLVCGQPLTVYMRLTHGDFAPEELQAQLVIGHTDGIDFVDAPDIIKLTPRQGPDNTLIYSGTYVATRNGRYAYGIRVLPITQGVDNALNNNLVLWG